jgi:hypothetical protein
MRRRLMTVAILVSALCGCSTWRPVAVSPREYVETTTPDWVRVHYGAGSVRTLKQPWVSGDSLREQGTLCTNGQCVARNATAPLNGIIELQVRRTSVPRTTLFVVGLSFGALVFAFLVSGGVTIGLPPIT